MVADAEGVGCGVWVDVMIKASVGWGVIMERVLQPDSTLTSEIKVIALDIEREIFIIPPHMSQNIRV